jgi:hypothetical protein
MGSNNPEVVVHIVVMLVGSVILICVFCGDSRWVIEKDVAATSAVLNSVICNCEYDYDDP